MSLLTDRLFDTQNCRMPSLTFISSSIRVTEEISLFEIDLPGQSSFFCMFSLLLKELTLLVFRGPQGRLVLPTESPSLKKESLFTYTAITEISLDPTNSVIKRLWCILFAVAGVVRVAAIKGSPVHRP